MCIIDGNVDCIINPITNAIYNFFFPFIGWIINTVYSIYSFIYAIMVLSSTVYNLITGLLGDMFATNSDAAIVFSIILLGITIRILMRVWNLLAGISIFGFNLPRL